MTWIRISKFPGYSVNEEGLVRNDDTGRIMMLSQNQHGVVQVGLMRDRVQYKRGVALLVANAFLDRPRTPAFDTPINLNGDRTDNHVDNLTWRPRWFAITYHRQFFDEPCGFREPIIDIKTKEVFPTSWEAAIKYGLLDKEILIATLNRTYVWPTYQEFRVIA